MAIDNLDTQSVIDAVNASTPEKKPRTSSKKDKKEETAPVVTPAPDLLSGIEFTEKETTTAQLPVTASWLVRGNQRRNVWSQSANGTIMVGCSGAEVDPTSMRMVTDEQGRFTFLSFQAYSREHDAIRVNSNGTKTFLIQDAAGNPLKVLDHAGMVVYEIAKALHYLFTNGSLLEITGNLNSRPVPGPNGTTTQTSLIVHSIKVLTDKLITPQDVHELRFANGASPAARADIIRYLGLDAAQVHEPVSPSLTDDLFPNQ